MHLACLALLLVAPSVASPADTVVVCPRPLRGALSPWLEHRARQGRTFAFVEGAQSPEVIRAEIRRVARDAKPRFILLVGDADPELARNESVRARSTPTHYAQAKVTPRWGSERTIAADNWYADLDDDLVPDVAIGRLPADSPDELARMVRKIIVYETNTDFGPWRREVDLVAGVGGFGMVTDSVLEAATRRLVDQGIPVAYNVHFTNASWQSPFCPNPRDFQNETVEQLRRGDLFWVYMGHGSVRTVDFLQAGGERYPILTDSDAARLAEGSGFSIACFLACYTAAFDARRDCLAEELLRQEGGPVAVLGGTRVTMPYATAVMGSELLDQVFTRHAATLGEAILAAKRSLVAPDEDRLAARRAMDLMAGLFGPRPSELADERAEHLDLYTLLGDPALALRYPRPAELTAEVGAGGKLLVSGEAPIAGRCVLEFVTPRGALRFAAPTRTRFEEDAAAYNAVYHRANDPCWTRTEFDVDAGKFTATLEPPAEARGKCHLRVFITGVDDCAAGGADVEIERAAIEAADARGENPRSTRRD